MCGIICIIQYDDKINIDDALKCLSKLESRGPDSKNYSMIEEEGVQIFFGFTRLAIMDTSDAGSQPFSNINGDNVICNGEIYNYKELATEYDIIQKSNCDCEILLPIISKMGFKTTIRDLLDAEFATVYYSNNQNRIYAARDRYGVRPLYYGYNSNTKTIAIGSELKSIHPIMEYVEQLQPTDYIEIDLYAKYSKNNIQKKIYHEPLYANYIYDTIDTIHYKIRKLLTSAVGKRLCSDRPIGFLLSGGLDSSLIVSIATRILGPESMVCFSIGIENSPDIIAAKKVTEYLGIKNHYIIPFTVEMGINNLERVIEITETYDVTTIRASTPQELMAQYISQNTNIKVLLSGEGSDEIHASYRYFRDAPDSISLNDERKRLLSELYLFDNLRTDRTMADNGLEVRIPFLDFSYVDYVMNLDPNYFMYVDGYIEKQIIRDSFKGYLPDDILYRSKEAFSDAVSSDTVNWAKSIQIHAASIVYNIKNITDTLYKFNQPKTVDGLYFRNIFSEKYPERCNILPHYWLPKFQDTEITDPSATVLKCY